MLHCGSRSLFRRRHPGAGAVQPGEGPPDQTAVCSEILPSAWRTAPVRMTPRSTHDDGLPDKQKGTA